MTEANLPSMEEIRGDCVQRIVVKLNKVDDIAEAIRVLVDEGQNSLSLMNTRTSFSGMIAAHETLLTLLRDTIKEDIWSDIEQLSFLMARDVLAESVRQAGNTEPVVMLTGNNFMPAYRSFDEIEAVYQADTEGTYIHELWERIEAKTLAHEVFLGFPDYDNCIYGVDMTKWEQSEASLKDQPMDDLNEEWTWRDDK